MNTRMYCCAAAIAATVGTTLLAQDSMSTPMGMEKEKVYSGCIEAGATKGTFTLTHATRDSAMTMGTDAMAKDAMSKDAMSKGGMEMTTLSLTSKTIDLGGHVGHKVSVAGTEDAMSKGMHTFSVASLKMVSGTCGS